MMIDVFSIEFSQHFEKLQSKVLICYHKQYSDPNVASSNLSPFNIIKNFLEIENLYCYS